MVQTVFSQGDLCHKALQPCMRQIQQSLVSLDQGSLLRWPERVCLFNGVWKPHSRATWRWTGQGPQPGFAVCCVSLDQLMGLSEPQLSPQELKRTLATFSGLGRIQSTEASRMLVISPSHPPLSQGRKASGNIYPSAGCLVA